ncbi:hypothetical protein MRX96_020811 [Rhipicephalus microplus]
MGVAIPAHYGSTSEAIGEPHKEFGIPLACAEQTTGLQVLKPRSPAPATSKTPNYWDNAAEHERVDEHAMLPEPEPLMDAKENGSESSHDGTDTEQAASISPETSSAETFRESWVVSLSGGEMLSTTATPCPKVSTKRSTLATLDLPARWDRI